MKIIHTKGVFLRRSTRLTCLHEAVEVDEDMRTIECKECGKIIDPFDFLVSWSHRESRAYETKIYLEKEVERLDKKRRNLERKIEKLKA